MTIPLEYLAIIIAFILRMETSFFRSGSFTSAIRMTRGPDVAFQVENAIFKVHRSVLAKYSSVIEGMLNAPQGNDSRGGTDDNPLVLTGDSVVAWESLLGWQYERFVPIQPNDDKILFSTW
jgi:BTB/POZ domain